MSFLITIGSYAGLAGQAHGDRKHIRDIIARRLSSEAGAYLDSEQGASGSPQASCEGRTRSDSPRGV